jgi:hypothetical protein
VPTVLKSGSLNLLEPSGPVQACNGIALLYQVTNGLIDAHGLYIKRGGFMSSRNPKIIHAQLYLMEQVELQPYFYDVIYLKV